MNPIPAPANTRIRTAAQSDIDTLARLINAAFRVEQPFIEGDRINPDGVRAYMEKGKFLLAEDATGLAGCVYVELRGDRRKMRFIFIVSLAAFMLALAPGARSGDKPPPKDLFQGELIVYETYDDAKRPSGKRDECSPPLRFAIDGW